MKKLLIAFLLASTAIAGVYYFQDVPPSGVMAASVPEADTKSATSETGNTASRFGQSPARGAESNGATDTNAGAESKVDESALRYFAARGDKVRLQAEIARLKALYPDWTPPENPLAPVQVRDSKLDELWKLFADGQYGELRRAIATRKIQEPEWVVPADLLAKLDLAEARQRLVNASDNKQYEMVVNLAAQTPALLTCSEVDVLWRLAEAFAKLDKNDRARDGYLYVLQNCSAPAERLVTVQKALDNLPYAQAQQVLAQQKTDASGKGEFAALDDDIARRFIAHAAQDPDMNIDQRYLATLEAAVQKDGAATDAETLGWYYLRRNDMATAEKWFLTARNKEDTATSAQGLALALNSRGDYAQAENVMFRWRDQTPEATAVYFATTANLLATDPPARMPAAIPQDVMSRIAAAVIAAKNVATAEQLGWYARAIGQQRTAIQWFQTALSWDNSNEPSAYGLAVSLFTNGDKAGLEQVKRAWGGLSPRIAEVGTERDRHSRAVLATTIPAPVTSANPIYANSIYNGQMVQQAPVQRSQPVQASSPRASRVANTGNTANTSGTGSRAGSRDCRTTLEGPMPTGGNAVAHGWCLMDMNRPLEAVKMFESALATGSAKDRSEAAYGQSLAYQRVGLVDKAAVSAIKAPMSQARQKELRISILSDRAVAAFQGGQFRDTLLILQQRAQLAPPRRDLMALQAASYLKLRRLDDARIVYEALAASGDREGVRGLAAVKDMRLAH